MTHYERSKLMSALTIGRVGLLMELDKHQEGLIFARILKPTKLQPSSLSEALTKLMALGLVSQDANEVYHITDYGRKTVQLSVSLLQLERKFVSHPARSRESNWQSKKKKGD